MIAIVEYDAGNVRSVINALKRCGVAEYSLTSDPSTLASSEKVILPGVGDASVALSSLRAIGLDAVIVGLTQPVLGICVGMQAMCSWTEEGGAAGLGIFDTPVKRFCLEDPSLKVPHMGWNTVSDLLSPLFAGFDSDPFVYYVHSFYAPVCPDTIGVTVHGIPFSAALRKDNFYGTQFHPEKSGKAGERILKNFLAL